jgi:hypothetical protein
MTNPTAYTVHVPYINVHIYKNGSKLGDATALNLTINTGRNTNLTVRARWDPTQSGVAAQHIGRDLISQYISGHNISIVAKTHRDSIPRLPAVGTSLSQLKITIPVPPPPDLPNNPDPGSTHRFLRDATFHVLSSTATFTLISPLPHDTLWIETIDAVALYNHSDPIGSIRYADAPFPATPGISRTPKLPVHWSLDAIGRERLRQALGGELSLDARANVTVRLYRFEEDVWYHGRGIGTAIRP